MQRNEIKGGETERERERERERKREIRKVAGGMNEHGGEREEALRHQRPRAP